MKALLTQALLVTLAFSGFSQEEGKKAGPPAEKPAARDSEPRRGMVPSRYLADDTESFLIAMNRKLKINYRDRGPFGLSQKPGEEKGWVPPTRPDRKRVTPFADIIAAINVSAVFSADQEFMVESTIYRQAQVVPLQVEGRKMSVRIENVGASAITFKNLDSGEVVQKRLDLLPRGVMVGIGPDSVPGVVPFGGARPPTLHVDLNTTPRTP